MDHPFPAGSKWGGLNKRIDPTELSPEQSPDTLNSFFYDKKMGLLGPRLGKTYAGADTYNIWGVMPYNISGQLGHLIAYGDSTSTEIDFKNIYNFTIPHGGWGDAGKSAPAAQIPAAITRILGNLWEVTMADSASSIAQNAATVYDGGSQIITNIDITGIETMCCTWMDAAADVKGEVEIQIKTDQFDWATLANYTVETDCTGAVLTDELPQAYMDVNASTTLLGIRAKMYNRDSSAADVAFGSVFVLMGCGVTAANRGAIA